LNAVDSRMKKEKSEGGCERRIGR